MAKEEKKIVSKKETKNSSKTKVSKVETKTKIKPKEKIAEKEIKKTTKKVVAEPKQEKKVVKKEISNETTSFSKETVFLLLATCIISLIMGWAICFKMQYRDSIVAQDRYLKKFVDEYEEVKNNYYKNIDWKKALDNSMEGLLKSLDDDYAGIIRADDASTYNSTINGEYEGLGMEVISANDKIKVISVFKNSPADLAGIKIDDEIIKVDDIDLIGKSADVLTDYVEKTDKEVELTINRKKEEKKIKITKGKIIVPSVSSEMIDEEQKIGYIELSRFSYNTYAIFKEELNKLEKNGMQKLIIDVRGNNGGVLQSAYQVTSEFLDSSKIVYQIETNQETTKFYSEGTKTKNYPIVVLQDTNSTSGAEILSSALKENLNATIIGTESYGKGTVQELHYMDNGSEYKFTTKKWLTSKSKWIDTIGVKPTIEEPASKEYRENPTRENDNQLKKALEYLTEK